jgi:hypothetical protein
LFLNAKQQNLTFAPQALWIKTTTNNCGVCEAYVKV